MRKQRCLREQVFPYAVRGTFSGRCACSQRLQAMLVFGLVPRGRVFSHGLHTQKVNTSQEESDFSQMYKAAQ